MTGLMPAIDAFHFIRPLWLALLLVIFAVWADVRRRARKPAPNVAGFAPHLRAALTVGVDRRPRLLPIDGVALVLLLATAAAAGPTWSRVPDPFVTQTAPVVIVLKVAKSMTNPDVAPSRLERAKQKIRDFLALRSGARTALVAYAGTSHTVVPMTEDPAVMQPYLEGLEPDVMPKEGDDPVGALDRAKAILAAEQTPGGILFVTDAIAPADANTLTQDKAESLALLSMLPSGAGDAGIAALDMPVISVTPDDADIRSLDRTLNAAYQRALTEQSTQPWDDRGWLLAWPAAAMAALWFRRGWTMRWMILLMVGLNIMPASQVRAEGMTDWFLTADQQGRIAYQRKEYAHAAELFADPLWKSWALYRAGKYSEAALAASRVETAEASFLQGMAHIKGREYREGIAAFEVTLKRDPDFPAAAANLSVAKAILAYVEEAREQSDTGEDGGMGADEVVFDNKDARGTETREQGGKGNGKLLTADQWMNTVDTRTGDFLRQRFAIEAAEQQ